ncbi:MAG: hypothetical protein RL562_3572 [Planctomycetota bacterium]
MAPASSDAEMPDPGRTRGVLRTTVDVVTECALVLAILGMTVVTWVPESEPRAMAQTAVACAAIGIGYGVSFLRAVGRRQRQQATGADAWAPSIQDGLRAGAGLVLGVLASGRAVGWW